MAATDATAAGVAVTPFDAAGLVVTCGTGGVGKTTIAAAIALQQAGRGRRVGLLTIDPARRLADALGLAGLGNEPQPVPLPADFPAVGGGSLHACMLDTAATFDATVRRYAGDGPQAERILANPFYRNIATTLGGTHEYMAGERVRALRADGGFDLLVVDTPPSRNALDFVSAPERLVRLLENRVFRMMMAPARGGMRLVSGATQALLRSLGSVVGAGVMADAMAFFQAFAGMEDGFRERARAASAALRSDDACWALVTTATAEALSESAWFATRIEQHGIRLGAVVANQVLPDCCRALSPGDGSGDLPAALLELAAAAEAEDGQLARLVQHVAGAERRAVHVPLLRVSTRAEEIGTLDALAALLGG